MSKLVLLHGPAWDGGEVRAALDAEQIARTVITSIAAGLIDDRPTVLLLDDMLRRSLGPEGVRAAADAGASIVALGAAGESDLPATMPGAELAPIFLTAPVGARQLLAALKAAFREAAGRAEILKGRSEVAARSKEITELTQIGVALTTERNYDVLLEMILTQSRRITQSDGGSLYLVEGRDTPSPKVRFKLAQNDTVPNAPFVEFTMPLNHASIGGYVCADRRDGGDRRRLLPPARRGVLDQPQLRRAQPLPLQVDAHGPDEEPQERDHRGAAAHQPQARPRGRPRRRPRSSRRRSSRSRGARSRS